MKQLILKKYWKTNDRSNELLKMKGQIEQYEWRVFGAFKMKGHIEQYSSRLITVLHIKVQIKQYKLKVFGAFKNERTYWAKQIKGIMERLILKKYCKWKVWWAFENEDKLSNMNERSLELLNARTS